MPICRRRLDEQHGNPWICECPLCRREKMTIDPRDGSTGEDSLRALSEEPLKGEEE